MADRRYETENSKNSIDFCITLGDPKCGKSRQDEDFMCEIDR